MYIFYGEVTYSFNRVFKRVAEEKKKKLRTVSFWVLIVPERRLNWRGEDTSYKLQ